MKKQQDQKIRRFVRWIPTNKPSDLLIFLFILLTGCTVPVAGALEDSEANQVVVALERASVDATKEVDPQAEGKWRVTVVRDDVPHALAVMRDEELPRSRPPGVLDAVGKGALVPSEAAEHAWACMGAGGGMPFPMASGEGPYDIVFAINDKPVAWWPMEAIIQAQHAPGSDLARWMKDMHRAVVKRRKQIADQHAAPPAPPGAASKTAPKTVPKAPAPPPAKH